MRNFALVYVEMAMERSTGEQQLEQVGHACCLAAQRHDPSVSCQRRRACLCLHGTAAGYLPFSNVL